MSRTSTYIIAKTEPDMLVAALAISNDVSFREAQRATMAANDFSPDTAPSGLAPYIPGTLYFGQSVPWQDPPSGTQYAYDELKSGRAEWPQLDPDPAPSSGGGGGGLLIIGGLAAVAAFFLFGKKRRR